MKRTRLILCGALAGVAVAAIGTAALANRPYTSTGVIRIAPAVIPERFVTSERIPMDRISSGVLQTVLSRGNLSNVINLYDIYASERSRMPMEDVIEIMRKAIQAKTVNETVLEISFTYKDRIATQKVAADLISRIITEHVRFRQMQSMMTLQFMKDSVSGAAADWESSIAHVRAAQAAGQLTDRVRLDSEIARRRYESLSAKVQEAEMMRMLEQRQQGSTLEVVEPASLPSERPRQWALAVLAGAAAGALLGWIVILLRAPRRRNEMAEAL